MIHRNYQETISYFQRGFATLFERKNSGYSVAFPNNKLNTIGLFFQLEDFKTLLGELNVTATWNVLPKEFVITLKYSPIALFKKWIIVISNEKLLKPHERENKFQKEFFFLFIDNNPYLFSLTTNIAHERFLLDVFQKPTIEDYSVNFRTFINHDKKIVIYKDYEKKKISTISLKGQFQEKRPYVVKIRVVKSNSVIKFRVLVGSTYKANHVVKLKNVSDKNIKLETISKMKDDVFYKEIKEYRKEVFNLLESKQEEIFETNKHANISLGRINKTSILVNLPKKYANFQVKVVIDRENQKVKIVDIKNKQLKVFSVSMSPKSNWLEGK